jgi:hypothetical protein
MTPAQNLNSVFYSDKYYEIGANLDSYHLKNILQTGKPDDLGIIEYWSQMQQTATPLYLMSSFGGKNIRTVEDPMGRYIWKTPVINDLPHITRDISPSNVKKGIAGQPFQIALNRRAFSYTDVISYDKMSGLELLVLDTEIIALQDEFIYTVRLMNNANGNYLNNQYLVPQTSFFRKYSLKAPDYGERYAEVYTRTGLRTYYNFVGGGVATASFSVSNMAERMMRANYNRKTGSIDLMPSNGGGKKQVPVREFWKINDWKQAWAKDPSIVSIPDAANKLGQAGIIEGLQDGWLDRSVVTSLEQACITKLVEDIENNLMWGLGGRTTTDGPDMVRTTVGLWKQMDNAFKTVYNIGTFTLNILEDQVYNFFRGRVDFVGPDPERKLVVQTGIAGMRQINNAIKTMAVNAGLVINATEVGAISNMKLKDGQSLMQSGMDLDFGYAYTSYTIPFLANLKFVVNPALDPVLANDIENPWVNGYRTSSYCYIVWDITDNPEDNIFLMKKQTDEDDFQWFYQNGTSDYMGSTKNFQSSGLWSGFKVFMTMDHKSIQVIDNTKLLKIVPYNVVTKMPYGG